MSDAWGKKGRFRRRLRGSAEAGGRTESRVDSETDAGPEPRSGGETGVGGEPDAVGARLFGEKRPEFADNMRHYVEYLRENDVTLTHALINLQRSRNASGMFNLQEGTALEVTKETSAGVVVRGARILATLGPLSDEIAVYSPRMARHTEDHSPFAVSFSIPCSTKGLKFLCRDSFDLGRSHFDAPLGSRFEARGSIAHRLPA